MLENVVFLCMGILTLAMLLNVARLVEGRTWLIGFWHWILFISTRWR